MRMMDDRHLAVIHKSPFVLYLDYILIFNKAWEEHLQHIQQVLSTLQQHKLYANLEKY